MKNVLILTHDEDPHSASVKKYFEDIGVNYFEVLTDKLIGKYNITFNLSKGFYISNKEEEIFLDDSWNIWNRRVMDPEIPNHIPKRLEDVILTETKRTWEGLLFSHKGKVINRPRANFNANNKVDQMLFATNYGNKISVPKTLLTNDSKRFIQFYNDNEKVSFKLLRAPMIKVENDYLTCYNNIVSDKDLKNADLIKNNPSLFQEYIDKDYEIRITALENKVVGIKIDSQNSNLSKVDFRRYDFDNVGYEKIELPKNIEVFCQDMLKHYGLSFGEFDFIKKNNDEYVFLELNPNGQWLWLELKSNYNLTIDVAENLL